MKIPSFEKCSALFAIALFAGLLSVRANAIYTGSISGTFLNPVLQGTVVDPLTGNLTFLNNTTTAVYTGFGTNAITWGAPNPISGPSSLTFTGHSFSGIAPGQIFDLGTVTYFNGNNFNDGFIFGATLTLAVNSTIGGSVDPSVSTLAFRSTINHPPAQPPATDAQNADFVRFSAFPLTFNIFEGHTASAELFGEIVGDPQLVLTGIELSPGQSNNGFVGHGVPGLVPESGSTLALMAVGFAALTAFGISRRTARIA